MDNLLQRLISQLMGRQQQGQGDPEYNKWIDSREPQGNGNQDLYQLGNDASAWGPSGPPMGNTRGQQSPSMSPGPLRPQNFGINERFMSPRQSRSPLDILQRLGGRR